MNEHLLYLHPAGLLIWRKNRAALTLEAEFSAEDEGVRQFARFLQNHRGSRLRLVVDSPDERYQPDTPPRLRGAERRAVWQRKCAQAHPGTPYLTTLPLPDTAESRARKQHNVVHLALPNPALLAPWMDALRTNRAPLASLHCLSQAAPRLLGQPQSALLVMPTRAGLRHVFVDQGRLRFSRSTPLAAGEATLEHILDEADHTRQYLIRERALSRSDILPLWLLLPAPPASGFHREGMDCQPLDVARVAAALGLRSLPGEYAIEALAAWALATQPPREQLASAAERIHHTLQRARVGINIASALIGLGLAASAAWLWADARQMIAATPAVLPASAPPPRLDQLRALSASIEQLTRASPAPRALLEAVSSVLDHHPAIELERIEWQTLGTSGSRATLSGQVATEGDDPRAQINALESFTQALQGLPGAEVTLTRLPLDLRPEKTLRAAEASSGETAPFALTVSLKP